MHHSYFWQHHEEVLRKERERYAGLTPEQRTARWKNLRKRRDDRRRAALAPTPDEEWRRIQEFPAYEVSSLGRVRRIERGAATQIGRIRIPQVSRKGYAALMLLSSTSAKTIPVHRLVALTFIGPPPTPTHQVNHKDTDKANNRVENLEWVTPLEQMRHAVEHGRLKGRAHWSKLDRAQVQEIKHLLATTTLSQQAIADRFGVWQSTISMIKRKRFWADV